MAEGSTGTAVYGSRQLSITHSRSLKGRLQCSCPVSLCFAVPYFILSMLKHCSNASIAAHTHTQTTHKCHTMTHVLVARFGKLLIWWLTDSFETNTMHTFLSQNSLEFKKEKNLYVCKGSYRTNKTFYANKEKHSAAVKHNTLFSISLLCQ